MVSGSFSGCFSVALPNLFTYNVYNVTKHYPLEFSIQREVLMNRPAFRLSTGPLALAVLLTLPHSGYATEKEIVWDKIERGILYTTVTTESLRKDGAALIHVYNIDNSRYTLRLFHSRELGRDRPLSFDEWYQQTDAPLLFNVCPDKEGKGPRGYLRVSGKTIHPQLHHAWKGLLVMGPVDGSYPPTRVLDLNNEPFDPLNPAFLDVLQEPMLFDGENPLRVEPREFRAKRVALAEDENRNTLIFLTDTPCTLWEMANWLRTSPFALTRAISLGQGNAPQALGQFAPQRVYIVGQTDEGGQGGIRGSVLQDLLSSRRLDAVLGVEPLAR
jgi:hypothetical protein